MCIFVNIVVIFKQTRTDRILTHYFDNRLVPIGISVKLNFILLNFWFIGGHCL